MRHKKRWVAAAALAADLATKELARGIPAGGTALIPGWLGLRYVRNRGIAFSLLSGRPRLVAALSLLLILGAAWILRDRKTGAWPETGLMLMLGGAAGNLLDRLALGYVPDWIELLFIRFPVFNLADICLTAGCALVMISLLFRPGDWGDRNGRDV